MKRGKASAVRLGAVRARSTGSGWSVDVSVCCGWQARRTGARRGGPLRRRTARTRWPRQRSPKKTPTVRPPLARLSRLLTNYSALSILESCTSVNALIVAFQQPVFLEQNILTNTLSCVCVICRLTRIRIKVLVCSYQVTRSYKTFFKAKLHTSKIFLLIRQLQKILLNTKNSFSLYFFLYVCVMCKITHRLNLDTHTINGPVKSSNQISVPKHPV